MRIFWFWVALGVALLVALTPSPAPPPPAGAAPDATGTLYPVYLPYVQRRVALLPPPLATPTLPPPTTITYTGYFCLRPPDAFSCWSSARFRLMRGPGEACGPDMSVSLFLASGVVNLDHQDLYVGRYVQVRGTTEELPSCENPLLYVDRLDVLPSP